MLTLNLLLQLITLLQYSVYLFGTSTKITSYKSGKRHFRIEGERHGGLLHHKTLEFPEIDCISEFIIDSLDPLTGDEDIQILYKQCQNQYRWKVVHYRSVQFRYTLLRSVFARSIAVVSLSHLPIVSVTPVGCLHTAVLLPTVSCNKRDDAPRHRMRHHVRRRRRDGLFSSALHHRHRADTTKPTWQRLLFGELLMKHQKQSNNEQDKVHRRTKRQATSDVSSSELGGSLTTDKTLTLEHSPYEVTSDVIVTADAQLTIDAGVQLHFAPTVGITVYGRLVARGTPVNPILMFPAVAGAEWRGLLFLREQQDFDVRLSNPRTGNDGTIELYDTATRKWRSVCGLHWGVEEANVVCRQLGFQQGAASSAGPQASLDATLSADYWLTGVSCDGGETNLGQCLKSFADSCAETAASVTCAGIADKSIRKASVLTHVNVTTTLNGVQAIGSPLPQISYLISQQSRTNGLTLTAHYDTAQLHPVSIQGATLMNNRQNGLRLLLHYPLISPSDGSWSEPLVFGLLATSNRQDGVQIVGRGRIRVVDGRLFTNTFDGINIDLSAGAVVFSNTLSASNSRHSWNIYREANSKERLTVNMRNCNSTGHWWGTAVRMDLGEHADVTVDSCHFWDNYNGALSVGPFGNSTVRVQNSNFTRNRGRTVVFERIDDHSGLLFDGNLVTLNVLGNHSAHHSVVDVTLGPGAHVSTDVIISNNRFEKNTMWSVLWLKDNHSAPATDAQLTVTNNRFEANLAPAVLLLDVQRATIDHNTLVNAGSRCQLRTGKRRQGFGLARIAAQNNYWGADDDESVSLSICASNQQSDLMSATYLPFITHDDTDTAQTFTPITPGTLAPDDGTNVIDTGTINDNVREPLGNGEQIGGSLGSRRIDASQWPTHVVQSIAVYEADSVTIGPGATLRFESGTSLLAIGTLILRGTADRPVILDSAGDQPWDGVVLDDQGSTSSSVVAEHCVIRNALNGLSINSKRVSLFKCRIERPLYSGVLIGERSSTDIDFRDTTVFDSQARGVFVFLRTAPLTISNLKVINSGTTSLHFDSPAGAISVRNVKIDKSGEYGIKFDRARYSRASILFEAVDVTNQQRGIAGLFVNAFDYSRFSVTGSAFINNTVPSVQISARCNYTASAAVPSFSMTANRFLNNTNLVALLSLIYCTRAAIERNEFIGNNRDFRFGALEVSVEPSAGQTGRFELVLRDNLFEGNNGEFVVYLLAMTPHPFVGNFSNNSLRRNANRRAALIAGSPAFTTKFNEFENPASTYELEVEYNDVAVLDATQNYWGDNTQTGVRRRILDGEVIGTRGLVKYWPFVTRTVGPTDQPSPTPKHNCQAVNNCNGHGECLGSNVCQCEPGYSGVACGQFSCRARRFCSGNGECAGPNICRCHDGWTDDTCARPRCASLNDCGGDLRGSCVSPDECQCFPGYAGRDCSVTDNGAFQCGADGRCSGHGQCLGTSTGCKCDPGWRQPLCDLPDCAALNNCTTSSNGRCVAPSSCQCNAGFTGADCSVVVGGSCGIGGNCFGRGRCSSGGCVCNQGWRPPYCQLASCSGVRDCNGLGECISPDECRCKDGLGGSDCSRCLLATCDHLYCVVRCIHGRCDKATRKCVCESNWRGAACDVCESGGGGDCTLTPSLQYVLPQSAAIDAGDDQRIYAIGTHLPGPADLTYECYFGSRAAPGAWITERMVACRLPSKPQTIGNVQFFLVPHNERAIATADDAQIRFSFYSPCSSAGCSGVCVGPSCVCLKGQSGGSCQNRNQPPTIDAAVVSTNTARTATEGRKYELQLKVTGDSAMLKWELNKAPNGLHIDQKGLVIWPYPIGSNQPNNVSAIVHNYHGSSQLMWQITVPPQYKPVIEKLAPLNPNRFPVVLNGSVTFGTTADVIPNSPIKLAAFRKGQLERVDLIQATNGTFSHTFLPNAGKEDGEYTFAAFHPSVMNTTMKVPGADSKIRLLVPGFHLSTGKEALVTGASPVTFGATIKLENTGAKSLEELNTQVIEPTKGIELMSATWKDSNGGMLTPPVSVSENSVVTAALSISMRDQQNIPGSLLLMVSSKSGINRVIRLKLSRRYDDTKLIATPSSINASLSRRGDIIQLTVTNLGSNPAPRSAVTLPESSPIFLISTDPQPLPEKLELGKTIRLTFGTIPAYSTAESGVVSGSIRLTDASTKDSLVTIPYTLHRLSPGTTNREFDVFVTVIDETSQNDSESVNGAEVQLMNQADGYADTRYVVNRAPAVFQSVSEGLYQLVVTAPGHTRISQTIKLSPTSNRLQILAPKSVVNYQLLLFKEKGASSFQLTAEITRDTPGQLPIILFNPLNVRHYSTKPLQLTMLNSGNGTAYFRGFYVRSHQPDITIFMKPLDQALVAGQSASIEVELNVVDLGHCTSAVVTVPYQYGGERHLTGFAKFNIVPSLIDLTDGSVCEVFNTTDNYRRPTIDSTVVVTAVTPIYCDCLSARLVAACQIIKL